MSGVAGRPISEAPRDGTVIIVEVVGYAGVPETGHYAFERVRWSTDPEFLSGWKSLDNPYVSYGESCFTGWWTDGSDLSSLPKTPRTNFKWRPSNFGEGDIFQAEWCARCTKDREDDCPILLASFTFDIGDEDYPVEWTERDGKPVCTAFDPSPPAHGGGNG